MANKYFRNGTDLTTIIEPKSYTQAAWCADYFKNEPFQKPGSDSETKNVTIDQYTYGSSGTKMKGVARGYFPTAKVGDTNIFDGASLFQVIVGGPSSGGTTTMTRTSSGIKFNFPDGTTSTLGASSFRNNYVPKEIIILLVGGGGGAGGTSYYKYAKDDYRPARGAAGSGGGCVVGRFQLQDNIPYYITVGAGGKYGSSGAAGGENDSTSGSSGGNSVFMNKNTNTNIFVAYGGSGGGGGDLSGNYGAARSAGSYYVNTSYTASGIPGATGVTGGKGNSMGSTSASGVSALSWNPTGSTSGSPSATFVTAKNNNSSTENHSDSKGTTTGNSWYSGGCSWEYGSYWGSNGSSVTVPTYGGGGGAAGWFTNSSGSGGAAFLFY